MRHRTLSFPLAFILLLLLGFTPTLAQAPGEAVLTGQVVSAGDEQPLAGATVSVPAFGLETTTDADGRYTLVLPAAAVGQTVEVQAAFADLQVSRADVVVAAGTNTRNFVLAPSFFETITVGSRAAGAAAQDAVPVDILSADMVERTGSGETNQIIQALAPSFNFPRPTITDGTDTVRPATLRGLGPDQVLVLINGKRRHTSALVHVNGSIGRGSTGVDMNAIPASMIGEVEVLRDGAAAQYGSDAIAGVINFNLKSQPAPYQLSLRGGGTTHGDGELLDVTLTRGFELGRGSLVAALEYRDRKETNRAGPDPRDQIRPGDAASNPVAQPNHHWGDSDMRDIMAFFNGLWPVNFAQSTWFYAFGGASEREGSHAGFFRRALQDTNHPQIYPQGFLPLIEPEVTDYSGTGGVRGELGEWFWDTSLQYGHNRFEFHIRDSLNVSLGPTIPPNQTEFFSGALVFDQLVANSDWTREVEIGMAGPLNVAWGVEARREGYQIEAGEPASYVDGGQPNQFGGRAVPGAQVFPGFRPSNEVDETRTSYAAYLDLEGNVHRLLRLGLAGRFEDYDDFGTTNDYKLTARLQPVQPLVLRAGVSTGFRAPSLGQSFFNAVSTNFLAVGVVLVPFEVGTFPVSSPVARALGAEDLEAEESEHRSAGLVWSPTPDFQLSADYYHVDIENRIVLSGNFTGPRVQAILAPFAVTGARFFTNAIDTETEGYDLSASYNWDLDDLGLLRLLAGYNRTENEVVRVAPTPPQLTGLQEVLFDRTERLRVECGQPEDTFKLTADYGLNRFNTLLRTTRYGEYCLADRRVVDQTFGEEWLVDLEFSYRFEPVTVAIGAQNVFDAFPDRNLPLNANLGIFTYPSHSPFGMNGTFVYSRVEFTF
jgi:iron complex outermembrane receptor protein